MIVTNLHIIFTSYNDEHIDKWLNENELSERLVKSKLPNFKNEQTIFPDFLVNSYNTNINFPIEYLKFFTTLVKEINNKKSKI